MTIESLVFATRNENKISEFKSILENEISLIENHFKVPEIRSLTDINCHRDLEESGSSFKENAFMKAQYVFSHYQLNCFAEDSGLEVEILGGAPGVHSARFAGPKSNDQKNISQLLNMLRGKDNRKARFRTVISLIIGSKVYFFSGDINGKIALSMRGKNGFGYDPIFQPDRYDKTFGELDSDMKNQISHRYVAAKKMIHFLVPLLPKIKYD